MAAFSCFRNSEDVIFAKPLVDGVTSLKFGFFSEKTYNQCTRTSCGESVDRERIKGSLNSFGVRKTYWPRCSGLWFNCKDMMIPKLFSSHLQRPLGYFWTVPFLTLQMSVFRILLNKGVSGVAALFLKSFSRSFTLALSLATIALATNISLMRVCFSLVRVCLLSIVFL